MKTAFIVGTVLALTALICALLTIPRRLAIDKYGPQTKFSHQDWMSDSLPTGVSSTRQKMIRDLILYVLPGKTRSDVEELLGKSATHVSMRRYTQADLLVRERSTDGSWKPFPRTGTGYYYEELDWDSIYPIGTEQRNLSSEYAELLPNSHLEMLIIRYDTNQVFASWYVAGSKLWPQVVGREGRRTFHRQRSKR